MDFPNGYPNLKKKKTWFDHRFSHKLPMVFPWIFPPLSERALLHLLRQLEASRSSRTVEHVHHGIQEPRRLGDALAALAALEMEGFSMGKSHGKS